MSILCFRIPDWQTGGELAGPEPQSDRTTRKSKKKSGQTSGLKSGRETGQTSRQEVGPEEKRSDQLISLLLMEAPRVVLGKGGLIWVDGRGMEVEGLAQRLFMRLAGFGLEGARVGISAKPVVAGVAARIGKEPLTIVPSGEEAGFLAPLPLSLLLEEETAEDADLLELLEGAGIGKCGELTKVSPDAIEVRFGVRGTELRNLARGDDRRALFRPIPAERPQASADFVDYTIRDATRIVFILNALLERVCETLRERSRRARSMTLTLTLAGGSRVQKQLRASRPTADRLFWIRQLRATLEKTRTGDAIVGVELEASQDEAISAIQGDLFDRGFVTSAAVEEVMARLTDAHPGLFVRRIESSHPLPEYRALQEEAPVEQETPDLYGPEDAALELRLLTEPRPVRVRTRNRRDHKLPVSFHHESGWRSVVAAGPHRVSCGHEEETPQAREYFRCVSDNGQLLWIYHDAVTEKWFLHGWWD